MGKRRKCRQRQHKLNKGRLTRHRHPTGPTVLRTNQACDGLQTRYHKCQNQREMTKFCYHKYKYRA